MKDGTDCTNAINFHRYIEEFTCSNPEATEKVLKDMRMSFPSANSSFSFFTMVFCAVSLLNNHYLKITRSQNYIYLTAVSAYKNELEGILSLKVFHAICLSYDGLVHIVE